MRILGVPVGEVTAVIPEGNSVRVEMEYDAQYDVPADAKAVIVTPTLVADRFVQLTPVYEGGPTMADGAEIELPDTGVPVELDRIYGEPADADPGARTQRRQRRRHPRQPAEGRTERLRGPGRQGQRDAARALRRGGDLRRRRRAAVRHGDHLAEFTTTLAENDKLVRAFMKDLAGVSQTLAAESDELQQAVAAVAGAVGSVEGFVRDNRDALVEERAQPDDGDVGDRRRRRRTSTRRSGSRRWRWPTCR